MNLPRPLREVLVFLVSLAAGSFVVWYWGRGQTATPMPTPIVSKVVQAAPVGSGLALHLLPGFRAAAIRVNEVSGVAGFVMPGDRVDVIQSGNHIAPQFLAENIRVLASAQDSEPQAHGAKVTSVVTLEVSPALALRLHRRTAESDITLVLRRLDETKTTAPQRTQEKTTRIEVIHGVLSTVREFIE